MVTKRIVIAVMLMWALAGCAGATDGQGAAVPILSQPRQPAELVANFLEDWKVGDYAGMYALLSPQSQGLTTLPVFEAIYGETAQALSLTDLTYTIGETRLQGLSAAVQYDVTITSPVFGEIVDAGRTMRLVQNNGAWGLAWSSMDIFDGLAAGSRLAVQSRRLPRAGILDRLGKPLVAPTGTRIALYAAQQNMVSVDECLNLLARVLMRRRADLATYFNLFNTDTVFYLGEIDSETDVIEGANLDATCAVSGRFDRETRLYVGNGAAVHVTGYIGQIPADQLENWQLRGYQSGDLIGISGIENLYEEQLAGKPEQVLRIVSQSGVLLRELAGRAGTDPQPVTLTIDRDLQLATAQAVADAFIYAEPNWATPGIATGAGAVVLDVNSGAVLSMVSYPFFDPGIFNPDTPALAQNPNLIADLFQDTRQPFRNRVVQEQYFPGSTFKIITTLAAANERLLTPTELFPCTLEWNGRERFGDTASPRLDWRYLEPEDSPKSQPAGDITMAQALAASCNPFFYEMGARLYLERGDTVLTDYAQRVGLGAPSNIDLGPNEAAGSLPPTTSVEAAINEAIGQGGIQVTLLQMARMVAAVANGGQLYQPYIVQQVGGEDGSTPSYVAAPSLVRELDFPAEVFAVTREGMCAVTTDETYGTASFVFLDTPYTVCGKTGTAQTGRPQPHGWFVAFAPADEPQIAIAVMVEFGREGSETAAPIVRRILDAYFNAPVYPFPEWWSSGPYVPLDIPENMTGG